MTQATPLGLELIHHRFILFFLRISSLSFPPIFSTNNIVEIREEEKIWLIEMDQFWVQCQIWNLIKSFLANRHKQWIHAIV
jgi:hypothetical protein